MTDDQEEYPALLPYYKRAAVLPVYWANKSQKFYVAADVLWKAQKSDWDTETDSAWQQPLAMDCLA